MTAETGTRTDTEEQVTFEQVGAVLIARLNRPEKVNALSAGISSGMHELVRRLNSGETGARAAIVTGEGRAFCAGGDVTTFPTSNQPGVRRGGPYSRPHPERSIARAMHSCDVPIIGAINGYAVGAGFGLALSTDLRIAADDAVFQVAQIKRGLVADMSTGPLLREALGNQRAMELMLSGRRVDAAEALALGLVLKVVPRERLLEQALALATAIAEGPPHGMAASKHVVYMGGDHDLEQADAFVSLSVAGLFKTDDAAEGVLAFRERREPRFTGR